MVKKVIAGRKEIRNGISLQMVTPRSKRTRRSKPKYNKYLKPAKNETSSISKRTRRSKHNYNKYFKHHNDQQSSITLYYPVYSGYSREHHNNILFKYQSEAFSFGYALASKDGVLRARQLSNSQSSLAVMESTHLDFVGVAQVRSSRVSKIKISYKSSIQNSFFSEVKVYRINETIKSSHLRVDSDLIKTCIDQFRNKHDYQHSAGSIFGGGKCIRSNSIRKQNDHCPVLKDSIDPTDGLIKMDKKFWFHRTDFYQKSGMSNSYPYIFFQFVPFMCQL